MRGNPAGFRWLPILLVLAMVLFAGGSSAFAGKDHDPKHIITVYDKDGNVLSKLAHSVSPGDYLITSDNKGWVVSRVEGRKAYAKYDGRVNLNPKDEPPRENLGSAVSNIWQKLTSAPGMAGEGGNDGKKGLVGLYCTHSDESYQPTSGKANEDKGDIYGVAATLKTGLEKAGYEVVLSQNNHNPHDAAAYTRSRRTVADLMKKRPIALIDVHRDAIPDPSYYKKSIGGEELAVTRVVVGKQNANRQVNLDFAKRIKAIADKRYPGLVKEIFWGKGNYNQDTGPKTILLEFGTHTVSEELASKGANRIAEILPAAIGGSAGAGAGSTPGGSPWRSLVWVVVGIVVIGGAFLAMNRSGMEFMKKGGTSSAGFLGRINRRRMKSARSMRGKGRKR